jgi:hypothetical protein
MPRHAPNGRKPPPLFRAPRDQGGAAWALTGLGLVERAAGDEGRARAYLVEALVWARSLGNQERIA